MAEASGSLEVPNGTTRPVARSVELQDRHTAEKEQYARKTQALEGKVLLALVAEETMQITIEPPLVSWERDAVASGAAQRLPTTSAEAQVCMP